LFDVGGETLTLVLHGRTAVRPDDVIGLRIDGAKAHLFDEGSGARIV
jgi:multiple sugar transport system ATP-binding protein